MGMRFGQEERLEGLQQAGAARSRVSGVSRIGKAGALIGELEAEHRPEAAEDRVDVLGAEGGEAHRMDPRVQLFCHDRGGIAVQDAAFLLQHLGQRPVGQAFPVGGAPSPQHVGRGRAPAQDAQDLLGQATLAHAGGADQGDELVLPVLHRPPVQGDQQLHLVRAPEQGSRQPFGRRPVHELQDPRHRALHFDPSPFPLPPSRNSERHVFSHVEMRKQCVVLKHHPEPPSRGGDAGDVLALHRDAPGVGRLESREQSQHRRLPAAARPQQGQDLAAADAQRHGVRREHGSEPLGDGVDRQKDRHRPFPRTLSSQ